MRTYVIPLRLCSVVFFQLIGICFFWVGSVMAVDVTLAWDPTVDSDLAGYKVYYRSCPAGEGCTGIGVVDGLSCLTVPLGTLADRNAPQYTAKGLPSGSDFVFVVTAYISSGMESGFSNEAYYMDGDSTDSGGNTDSSDGDTDNTTDTVTDQEIHATRIGLSPLLSATMSVAENQHAATRWQISLDENFTNLVLDKVSKVQLTRFQVPDMVLDTKTVYYWWATFLDESGQVLTQSRLAEFETVTPAETDDVDANGFVDDQEVDGTTLDLDENGVSDSDQDDLAFVALTSGDGQVGLKVAGGGAQVVALKSVSPTEISNTRNLPEMTDFGAVSFKLFLPDGQREASVTVYFSAPAPDGTDWFKYDPEAGWQLYGGAEISNDRRSVTYTLTDGDTGDDDGVVNGIIVDPAALGYRQTSDSDTSASGASSGSSGCFIATSALAGSGCLMPGLVILVTLIGAAAIGAAGGIKRALKGRINLLPVWIIFHLIFSPRNDLTKKGPPYGAAHFCFYP
jgi:hypothetical protein